MRSWFAERIWDLGVWFENRGLFLQDWYWKLRPSNIPSGPLSDIVTTTLANRSGALANSLLRNNALLQKLSEGE